MGVFSNLLSFEVFLQGIPDLADSAMGRVQASHAALQAAGRDHRQSRARRRSAQGMPPDIPGGRNDDAVARQLREVAQAGRNPEPKARLWDEYRRYKRGTP